MWIIIGVSIFVLIALIVAAALLYLSAVKKSNDDFTRGNTVDKLTTYKDNNTGVSLKVPEGWDVEKTKPDDKTVVRLTIQPTSGSFANAFDQQQVIDLLCQTTSNSMTKQSFANAVVMGVIPNKRAEGMTISNQSETTIGGMSAYQFNTTKQDDKQRTIYYHAYYMAGKSEVCSMYVLAVTSDMEQLPVESHVDDILGSFRKE